MEVAPRAIERKVVTALFCDVVGSTELGERLDPEDIDRLMGTYHRLARRRIEANGGTVEKFIGDAVVGVFGAPNVHEDDPARAIRAALAIIRELAAATLGLEVRIGIQTGEAVVRVGEERTAEEGLATGDILNTAARLQNAASPGGIAVGDPTYRATTPEFEWEDLGEVPLKGKALPVHVWRPLGDRREPAAPDAEATEFVGRTDELARLVRAVERASAERRLEVVTILAEPGMGKSRLVRELGRHVRAAGEVTWLRGRCLPYGDGVSFWALGEIVKARAGILEADDQATLRAKLEAAISDADPATRAWLVDRLAPLVGLQTDVAPPPQEEAFAAWTRFLLAQADDGPAVIVVEDLHWADPALVSFLGGLAETRHTAPLLLLVTARPEVSERHPEWLARAGRGEVIQLVSLGDDAIRRLVESTLAGASPALIATVLERAAGSPLFAEQLAALLRGRDPGAGAPALDESAIPATIQALLAARIDALPRELKPALLDASVIGRVFWSGAVGAMEDQEQARVASTLAALAARELTRSQVPSSMTGEAEYAFWHALLRDVAYSFLPRAARMAKHRAAAAWITARAGDGLADVAEIVTDHLRRALDLAVALGAEEEVPAIRSDLASALLSAADHTARIDPIRAIEELQAALALLEPADARRPLALTRLGSAYGARSEIARQIEAFEAAIAAHRALGDELAAAEVSIRYATALEGAGDEERATAIVEGVRPILEANPGPGLVALRVDEVMRASRGNHLERTNKAAEAALALADELGLPRPYAVLTQRGLTRIAVRDPGGEADFRLGIELAMAAGNNAHAFAYLANRAIVLDDIDEAMRAFDEAIEFANRYGLVDDAARALRLDRLFHAGRWDELLADASSMYDDAVRRGDAFATFMIRMYREGIGFDRGEAMTDADTLVADALAIGFRAWVAADVAAMAAFARGDAAEVRRIIEEAVATVDEGETLSGSAVPLVKLAVALGEVDLARLVLTRTDPETAPGAYAATSRLATALVLEAEGDIAGAAARFEASDEYFAAHGRQQPRRDTLAGLGRCRIARGDVDAGIDLLGRARDIAASMGARRSIDEIDAAIAAATSR